MKREISDRLLRSQFAQAREKPYELYDTRLPGFGLRVQPSGRRSFFVRWARNKRKTIGAVGVLTALQARKQAEKVLGNVFHGRPPDDGLTKAANTMSLGEFLDEHYEPFAKGHLVDARGALNRIRACFGHWLEKDLSQLDPGMFDRWVTQRRRAGIAPSTVNRDLATFSSALSRAVRWGFLADNPLRHVGKCRVDAKPRTRYLREDEQRRLLSTLRDRDARARERRETNNERRKRRCLPLLPPIKEFSDHLTPMVLLSLHTGCRRGELLSLTWDSICFSTQTLTIQGAKAKSGQSRIINLNQEAIRVLAEWQLACRKSDLIFPGPKHNRMGHVKHSWRRVLKDADIQRFRWHDLRHTFASNLVMAGVDLNTVRELMGHRDIAMTLRYAHLSDEHKQAAVERLCT